MKDEMAAWLKETVDNVGAAGIVLGISGGIDSAVCAALAIEALGKDRVVGIVMNIHNSTEDRECQQLVISALHMVTYVHNTEGMFESFRAHMPHAITNERLALANVKARIRMMTVYYRANAMNYMVCGTGNATELTFGYFTKWGDGGCDILPLADLYKGEVRELAAELNVPERIITRKPTAGLWEGQTDEDEIGMSYDRLDKILMFHKDEYPYDIAFEGMLEKGFTGDEIHKIYEMIRNSRHKRHMPKGIEIDVGHTYWYR